MAQPAKRWIRWVIAVVLALAGAGLYASWPYWNVDVEAEAAQLTEMLGLRPGMTAAEIGAGNGRMTVLVAQRLGPAGRMFSTEMEAKQIEEIRRAAVQASVQNVTVLEAGEKETRLPAGCCDAVFLRKVYHHFTDPAALSASLFASLRPGGRLAVIDFAPIPWFVWLGRPSGVPENRGGHGMPPAVLIEELTRAGFVLERRIDHWPGKNYCVLVRKPAATS